MRHVAKYRLPYSDEEIRWVQDEIAKLMKSGWLTQGSYLTQFETIFKQISGTRHCLGVSSGTAALEMLYWLYDAAEGSVVVPTNTFFASIAAALNIGAKVVLADVDPYTMSPTAAEIEARIRPDTKVVCLVHIAGIVTPEFDSIREVCASRGVRLIEDAAHAQGALHNGRPAGSLADGGAFSMHHSKVLTSGEGGVISFDDDALLEPLMRRRFHGLDYERNNYEVLLVGQNYKLPETSCILGLVQLRRWREIVESRRRTARIYDEILDSSNAITVPFAGSRDDHGLYKYPLLLAESQDKVAFRERMLREFGVDLPPNVYDHPCHAQRPAGQGGVVNRNEKFPGVETLRKRQVCLPMYADIPPDDAAYVARSVLAALS